ncbi:MAG: ATP-binding protein [Pseudomonadales bacterium]
MKKAILKGLSVGQRLLLLTVLPLFVITTLLTSYTVITRQIDREEVLSDRGSSMARYLAGAAEFGLFAGDFVTLKRLANAMMEQEDVRTIRFFDAQGELLLVIGGGDEDAKLTGLQRAFSLTRTGLLWEFQIPVYYTELDVDGFDVGVDSLPGGSDPLLGWVQLVMDEQRMRAEQQAILVTSIVMAVLGFLLLFLLAGYVARGISRPISKLTRTVTALGEGHLTERSQVNAKGEMGELARGIDSLAASVEASSEDLNARVEDATQQLTGALKTLERRHQQLEATREDLVKASAAKGDFLARMSHELRTPLTAVSGYAKLLQSMPLTDGQEEYLKSIVSASGILLSTIDDILDFTRLESGVVTIEALPFCLEDALEDVLAMHSLAAHQKQLELILFIEPDVPAYVVGDALRLRQVLTNLVGNALKFTDNGQVVVNVGFEALQEQNVLLKFSVSDSGIGISDVHQEQLFDAFSQADQTITRRFGGTGLGLAIAKELTSLMGGGITITSQLDQGTEIKFSISCEIVEQEEMGSEAKKVTTVGRIDRLYIYEKNPWTRRFLRTLGMTFSSNVSVCDSQEKLLVSLVSSSSEQDVLILGLSESELKEKRRNELLERIREQFSGPIIVLAGVEMMAVNELEDEGARFGPLYARSKPIRKEKLRHVLNLVQSYKEGVRQEGVFDFPGRPKSERLGGARILVAEDNDFNRNLICAVVEGEGGVAIGARDGVEALRVISADAIDLVLMDLNMPRLDGRLAVQEIRRSDAAIAKLPVIALTAEVLEGDDALLEEGFDRTLFKPLNETRLINVIEELLASGSEVEPEGEKVANEGQSFLSALPPRVLEEEVLRQLKLLKTALHNHDLKAVREQAHQLRSVLYGMINSDEVVTAVRNLEQACDSSNERGVAEVFSVLERLLKAQV